MSALSQAKVLITGGTGSFGRRFIELTLANHQPRSITVYSRDEMKQWELAELYRDDPRVRFIVGDVRDLSRLSDAFDGMDVVVHAAATKIVPTAEYNPNECIKTNVLGAMNVIEAAKAKRVPRVVALSTDKASNPINLYGASKLASDKLFVAANNADGSRGTSVFSVVRYGNVIGSRGSVIPFFQRVAKTGVLPITDPRMTRFMLTLDQAVETVSMALGEAIGGEIFVRKIPSMRLVDIAEAVAPNVPHEIIGLRPGEKVHEQMIGPDDAPFTYEYSGHYTILPSIHSWHQDESRIRGGRPVSEDFTYASNTNTHWMSPQDLQAWMADSTDA